MIDRFDHCAYTIYFRAAKEVLFYGPKPEEIFDFRASNGRKGREGSEYSEKKFTNRTGPD